jgi:hypothetical protein
MATLAPLYNQPVPAAVVLVAALSARQAQPDQRKTHEHIANRAGEGRTLKEKGRNRNPGAEREVEEANWPGDLGHCSNGDQDHQAAEDVIAEIKRRLGRQEQRRADQPSAPDGDFGRNEEQA